MKNIIVLLLFIGLNSQAYTQIGGTHLFDFLASPGSARATALGGSLIMIRDGDISQVQQNPALGNSEMDDKIALNHIFHFAGIQEGMLSYGKTLDSLKIHVHGSLQYVSYGEFTQADPIGNIVGEFKANEVALLVGASKKMNERIHLGTNLKLLTANYASENGFGLGVDLGATYQVPDKNWNLGLVVQNFGISSNTFGGDSNELPFDIKIGYANKLKHLPFRYTVTYHSVQQWDVRYEDPALALQTGIFGEVIQENVFKTEVDRFFRHLIFSGEFLFGKKGLFNLRFAYNHLRHQELKVSTFRSLGGFSMGFGMNIKRFQIDYGLGFYHLEGATNHLGIRLTLGDRWKD